MYLNGMNNSMERMKIKHSLDEMNLKMQLERAKNQTYRMSSAVLMHTGVNKAGLGDLMDMFSKGSRKGKNSGTSGKREKKKDESLYILLKMAAEKDTLLLRAGMNSQADQR